MITQAEVRKEVLGGDLMKHAYDSLLKQAPDVLAAVGVNLAIEVR